ncbi:MAG: cytochrome d ubiquinol oxidase subunit II [Thermoleophilia bacterium]|nr:cytochrome d ubiquinol oxidase subunit II [Thermoleophilia bacterium]
MDPTGLETFWFILIAVLWVGYLFLEGFDFGVGMLLPVLGRDDAERRSVISTIAPVWDGNEVWLLTAGGATFAAFPEWYATMFSGFYLPLFLILVALIVRGVAFEFRGKHDDPRWRATWDTAIVVGSAVPALLWGVAFANLVRGVALDADHEYAGSFLDLLNPYALLGGVATLAICAAHGAIFLTLRTDGDMRERARALARPLTLVVVAGGAAFLAWTIGRSISNDDLNTIALIAAIGTALAVILAAVMVLSRRDAIAFGAMGAGIALLVATIFASLWPNVMNSSGAPELALTISAAASTSYTLTVMTVVALVLTPVVLLYQGWTYWVFRHRVGGDVGGVRTPLDLLPGPAEN